jgi:Mce-associated membrane protein
MLRSGTKQSVSVADKGDEAVNAELDAADPQPAEDTDVVEAEGKSDTANPDASDPQPAEDAGEVEAEGKSDTANPDAADAEPAEDAGEVEAQQKSRKAKVRRVRVSVSVRTLVVTTVIVALLAGVGVLTWLYVGANAKLNDQARQAANISRAERIALDYAVGAAKIDAKNLDPWKKALVNGTAPELKEKLSSAATSMEQLLVPLQWNSTAVPLAAKVQSTTNGMYVVNTFVAVETKTMQAPDGLQSTATYSVTINSNHDWQISDVGGIGSVTGQK